LLYVLGLAIGFSSINQADLGSLKSLGLFSGLWSVIAPLPALFVGGFVVSRSAGATDRTTGALHGTVVWALSILGATWLVVNLLTGLVGGAFSAAKSTAQTAGQGVAGAAQAVGGGAANAAGGAANAGQGAGGAAGDLAKQFQLNPDDALRTVNARLQAAGKPTINPDQLQAAVKQALQSAVQQRSFDRQAFVKALEDNHLATGADADEIAGRVEGQFNAAKDALAKAGQAAESAGGKVAKVTGKPLWGIFAVLLLGAAATILGATAGLWRGTPTAHVATERHRQSAAVVHPAPPLRPEHGTEPHPPGDRRVPVGLRTEQLAAGGGRHVHRRRPRRRGGVRRPPLAGGTAAAGPRPAGGGPLAGHAGRAARPRRPDRRRPPRRRGPARPDAETGLTGQGSSR